LLGAAGILAYSEWPEHRFAGKTTFYSDDDGQTWFIDSVYKTTPFDHDGKQAVRAVIYSYDHGSKRFCAYLMRHNASDKKRLDDALAEAAREGKPASSITLFGNLKILNNMEVKQDGSGHSWVPVNSTAGADVVNAGLIDHNDGTLDVVYAE
jgi:phosphatidylserine/phosphatidylglycerophosphate/cardiolipin synthase-like enzyme